MQRTVLLLQFCLSVHLCIRRVYCDKTKWWTVAIIIPHKTAITLVFWHQQWLVGDAHSLSNICQKWPTPFEKRRLRQISAHNVSTIRDTEKSSIMTNRKSTTGFPTSYRWSVYVTPKSREGGPKKTFSFFGIEVNFNRIKSATKFLCVKTASGEWQQIAIFTHPHPQPINIIQYGDIVTRNADTSFITLR